MSETLSQFLQRHVLPPAEKHLMTHTRIPDKESGVYGGAFHIPDTEYETFMKLYYKDVFVAGKADTMTEKQLDVGVIAVDVDLRYTLETRERQHTRDHVVDLICLYLEKFKEIFVFEDGTAIDVFVFEKPHVNPLPKKNLTKDGVHILFGIAADRATQLLVRERVVAEIGDVWSDLPLTNTWEDVFDECISSGKNNWQLVGSKKPDCERYELVAAERHTYDAADGDFSCADILQSSSFEDLYPRLSVRYTGHPQLPLTPAAAARARGGGAPVRPTTPSAARARAAAPWEIRGPEELEAAVGEFLDSLKHQDFELREAHHYTMILPAKYYDDYALWMRVGWALKNISDRLFITWLAFSAKSAKFHFSDVGSLFEQWQKADPDRPKALTKRSIVHWAKTDAGEEFKRVRAESIDYFIDQSLRSATIRGGLASNEKQSHIQGCTDFDLAQVLYQIFKYEFVCASVGSNIWYQFKSHRWEKIEAGTTLRKSISTVLRELYTNKIEQIARQINASPATDEEKEKNKKLEQLINKVAEIVTRLGRTKEKDNIMKEAREIFYDQVFLKNLDTNPYLLCFNNGVIDFKENIFRRGYPEDYVSKSTKINYVAPADCKAEIMAEIRDFMAKLFPRAELHEYMWQHLASILIGTSSNQTFNMYVGIGQNGKSVLVNLMETILGEYKGDVPLTLITAQRTKVGGLAPELVQLKGVRYAVMQEPSKGDKINEGIMKQITSGIDPIQCRAPYMTEVLTYIPQFKLVVCTNELMEIKSNDHGTWRRIRVVEFLSLFTEKPVQGDKDKPYQFLIDKNIVEKFAAWKEVFMSMLVQKAFETGGIVKDCADVMLASQRYRQSQDYLAEFVEERLVVCPTGELAKRELNEEFRVWYSSSYGRNVPNARELYAYVDKHFSRFDSIAAKWHGISIRYEHGHTPHVGSGAGSYATSVAGTEEFDTESVASVAAAAAAPTAEDYGL